MQKIASLLLRSLLVAVALGAVAGCTKEAKKTRFLQRADTYFKTGEYEKAKIEYLNVLRLDRRNATAFEKIGFIWFEEGAPMRAAPFLFRAKELNPKNYDNRIKLARVLTGAGQFVDARKEAILLLEEAPGNPDVLVLLTETDRSAEDVTFTDEQARKFADHNSVAFHLAAANVALHKNDLRSAEAALHEALTVDPKSPPAHLAMAILSLLEKNEAQGLQELRTAANLATVRSTERLKLAEHLGQTGANEEAKTQLKDITSQAPDYLPAWRLAAQIAFDEKKYDDALGLLENVFTRDPDNIDSRLVQTQILLAKGETKKAVDSLEHLDKTYTDSPIIKLQLARAYQQNNNRNQAATTLTEAIAAKPDYIEAILMLAEVNLGRGNPQPVVAAMTDLLNKKPGFGQAQLLLAEAYRGTGQLEEAAGIYREQIKASPQNAQAHFLLGNILRDEKKTAAAREAYEKAAELAPDISLATDQLVDLDLASRNYEAATQRVQRQLERNPQAASAHFLQAKIAATQGKWDLAETEAQKTIDLDVNFSSAYDLLISCYIAENKLPQAIGRLEALLLKTPDNARALLVAALIYEKLNDIPKTRDAYERLLSVSPNSLLALNNLAYLYADKLNQLDRAYELARKARELQPSDPSTADTLGWILYKQRDYAQAVTLLEESAGKQTDSAEVQFHLGMARYMMGQTEAARVALEKAANATADFPGKKEAKERLASLRDHPEQGKEVGAQASQTPVNGQQPDDVIAQIRAAESLEKQGEFAKSAAEYEQALKANPKLIPVIVKLAQLNAGPLQNKNKAIEFAKKARGLAPTDPRIAGTLGTLAYQAGNYAWAYSLLQESARQLPDDAAILHSYAWASYSLGKVTEAQQTMQQIVDSAPQAGEAEDAKTFLMMTAANQNDKDPMTAEPDVSKILKTDGKYAPALMARATIQTQRGESKAAVATYGEVLSQFPDFAPAQKGLAALYADDPDEGTRAYDLAMKARKALVDDPELAQILGAISYKRKEYARAIQLLQESGRKKPLEAKGLYYLGMSYVHAKQESLALETLEKALTAGLKDPWAAEVKQAISDLQPK